MSLLDDVSIVVTPNAYKAGTLYGVLPTATESSELVTSWTNNDFASFASSGSNITQMVSSGSGNNNYSAVTITSGKIYKLKFTSSQAITCQIRISPNTNLTSATVVLSSLSLGSNEIQFTAPSTYAYIGFYAPGSFTDTQISDFTLKEQTKSDMSVTRATAATRVDENGLVNYAEILGSEVIVNGDFNGNANNWTLDSGVTYGNNNIIFNTTSNQKATQTQTFTVGKTYKVSIELVAFTSGTLTVRMGSVAKVIDTSTLGVKTWYIVATGNLARIEGTFGVGLNATVTNISVKESDRNNVPRIDYKGGGCPHILSEPQRTNLVTYSEDFSQWNIKQGTETLNYGISPDGTQNSTRIVFSGANLQFSNQLTTGTPSIGSIYVKGVNGETINFGLEGSESIFTLNGEWQRIQKTGTATSNKITVNTYGGATARDIQVWGGQLEEGSYATSYIPTSGSAVTRNTDQFSRDGISSLINSTTGVFFIEMAALLDEGTTADKWIALSDGTANNSVRIAYSGGANTIRAYINVGGSAQADMTYAVTDVTQFSKIAFSYAANNFNLWVDGVKRATDTSGNVFSANTLNRVGLDNGGGGSCPVKIKQLQVYKTALTDAQLTSLTS